MEIEYNNNTTTTDLCNNQNQEQQDYSSNFQTQNQYQNQQTQLKTSINPINNANNNEQFKNQLHQQNYVEEQQPQPFKAVSNISSLIQSLQAYTKKENKEITDEQYEQIISNQNKVSTVCIVSPQKYINIEKNFKLYDDVFISEDALLNYAFPESYGFYDQRHMNQVEPLNSFKMIDSAEFNQKTRTLKFTLQNRQNSNSPPLEYVSERFKSFGNQEMYELGLKIDQYNEIKHILQQKEPPCTLTEKQKDQIRNKMIGDNPETMLYMVEGSVSDSGFETCDTYFFAENFIKLLGYNTDDFQMDCLRQGLTQIRLQDETFKKLHYLIDIFLIKSQMKPEDIPEITTNYLMTEFLKCDGTKLIVNSKSEYYNKHGFKLLKYSLHGNDIPIYTKPIAIYSNFNQIQTEEEKEFIKVDQEQICDKKQERMRNIYQSGYREI